MGGRDDDEVVIIAGADDDGEQKQEAEPLSKWINVGQDQAGSNTSITEKETQPKAEISATYPWEAGFSPSLQRGALTIGDDEQQAKTNSLTVHPPKEHQVFVGHEELQAKPSNNVQNPSQNKIIDLPMTGCVLDEFYHVVSVQPDGAAANAKILPGDCILDVDDRSTAFLADVLRDKQPNDSVLVRLYRVKDYYGAGTFGVVVTLLVILGPQDGVTPAPLNNEPQHQTQPSIFCASVYMHRVLHRRKLEDPSVNEEQVRRQAQQQWWSSDFPAYQKRLGEIYASSQPSLIGGLQDDMLEETLYRLSAHLDLTASKGRVTSINPKGAAARAGICVGDELRNVNCTPVALFPALDFGIVSESLPGDQVRVKVKRDGERVKLNVVLSAGGKVTDGDVVKMRVKAKMIINVLEQQESIIGSNKPVEEFLSRIQKDFPQLGLSQVWAVAKCFLDHVLQDNKSTNWTPAEWGRMACNKWPQLTEVEKQAYLCDPSNAEDVSKPMPYIMFHKENFKRVKTAHPDVSFAEIGRIMGNEWKALKTKVDKQANATLPTTSAVEKKLVSTNTSAEKKEPWPPVVGSHLDVLDAPPSQLGWMTARVMASTSTNDQITNDQISIKYDGWSNKYNEWIYTQNRFRVAPLGCKTGTTLTNGLVVGFFNDPSRACILRVLPHSLPVGNNVNIAREYIVAMRQPWTLEALIDVWVNETSPLNNYLELTDNQFGVNGVGHKLHLAHMNWLVIQSSKQVRTSRVYKRGSRDIAGCSVEEAEIEARRAPPVLSEPTTSTSTQDTQASFVSSSTSMLSSSSSLSTVSALSLFLPENASPKQAQAKQEEVQEDSTGKIEVESTKEENSEEKKLEPKWKIGDHVDVLDTELSLLQVWLTGTVVDFTDERDKVKVNYDGWSCQFDVWLPMDSSNIDSLFTKTKIPIRNALCVAQEKLCDTNYDMVQIQRVLPDTFLKGTTADRCKILCVNNVPITKMEDLIKAFTTKDFTGYITVQYTNEALHNLILDENVNHLIVVNKAANTKHVYTRGSGSAQGIPLDEFIKQPITPPSIEQQPTTSDVALASLRQHSITAGAKFTATSGCVISSVDKHGPADKAGLLVGDVVLTSTRHQATSEEIRAERKKMYAGDSWLLTVRRNKNEFWSIEIVVASPTIGGAYLENLRLTAGLKASAAVQTPAELLEKAPSQYDSWKDFGWSIATTILVTVILTFCLLTPPRAPLNNNPQSGFASSEILPQNHKSLNCQVMDWSQCFDSVNGSCSCPSDTALWGLHRDVSSTKLLINLAICCQFPILDFPIPALNSLEWKQATNTTTDLLLMTLPSSHAVGCHDGVMTGLVVSPQKHRFGLTGAQCLVFLTGSLPIQRIELDTTVAHHNKGWVQCPRDFWMISLDANISMIRLGTSNTTSASVTTETLICGRFLPASTMQPAVKDVADFKKDLSLAVSLIQFHASCLLNQLKDILCTHHTICGKVARPLIHDTDCPSTLDSVLFVLLSALTVIGIFILLLCSAVSFFSLLFWGIHFLFFYLLSMVQV
jgi:S1-C subfamily serine protease